MKTVAVLDYGSGNIHSALRMLERVGANVQLTADPKVCSSADGLFVPGVGNFHACVEGLERAGGGQIIRERLADGGAILGVCVGMQVLFEGSTEESEAPRPGLGVLRGQVEKLQAKVVPHMGWSTLNPPEGSRLFEGVRDERFYFVHSFAARATQTNEPHNVEAPSSDTATAQTTDTKPLVTTATHGNEFIAAVERGVLSATQFHPEKSGDAGARLISNWIASL